MSETLSGVTNRDEKEGLRCWGGMIGLLELLEMPVVKGGISSSSTFSHDEWSNARREGSFSGTIPRDE